MADILASVSVALGADISGFRAAMAAARRELRGIVQQGEMMKDIGQSLTIGVSAPLAALGLAAGKVGADFQAAFNQVEAATQASGTELEQLNKLAQGIALNPDLKFSATQAAEALEGLAKNGLSTAEILGGAADASANLATATGSNLATSADVATDVMKNFNLTAQDLAASVSNITGTTLQSKFSLDGYREALAQAGAVAGQMGVNFKDFNTALAVTSSGFSSGSDAGTSFKTFIQRLVPQSKEAAAAMEKLGLKFFDAQGKMKPLRTIAGDLQKAFKGLSDEQRNQLGTEIFGADSIRTALLLAKDGAAGFDKMAESIGKVNAATQGAILNKGFAGGLEALKSAAEGLGIAIANSGILSFGEKLVRGGADVLAFAAKLDPEILQIGVAMAAVAAAVGPLLVALGSLGAALPAITAGAGALGLTLGPVVAVAAAVGAAAYLIINNWDDLVAYFGSNGEGGRVFGELARSVKEAVSSISTAFDGLDIGNSFGDLITAGDLVSSIFREITVGITGFVDTIGGIVRSVSALLNGDWARAWDGAKQAVAGLYAPLANLAGISLTELRRMLGVVGDAKPAQGVDILKNAFIDLNKGLAGYVDIAPEVAAASEQITTSASKAAKSLLTDEQIKALAAFQASLKLVDDQSRALGDGYDYLGNRAKALQSGVSTLLSAGFGPYSKVIRGIVTELRTLNGVLSETAKLEIKLPDGLDNIKTSAEIIATVKLNPLDTKVTQEIQQQLARLGLQVPPLDLTEFGASAEQLKAVAAELTKLPTLGALDVSQPIKSADELLVKLAVLTGVTLGPLPAVLGLDTSAPLTNLRVLEQQLSQLTGFAVAELPDLRGLDTSAPITSLAALRAALDALPEVEPLPAVEGLDISAPLSSLQQLKDALRNIGDTAALPAVPELDISRPLFSIQELSEGLARLSDTQLPPLPDVFGLSTERPINSLKDLQFALVQLTGIAVADLPDLRGIDVSEPISNIERLKTVLREFASTNASLGTLNVDGIVAPVNYATSVLNHLPKAVSGLQLPALPELPTIDTTNLTQSVTYIRNAAGELVNSITGLSDVAVRGITDFNTRAEEAIAGMNQVIASGLAEAAVSMAAGIADVINGAAPISALGGILLGAVGDVLVQLGKMAIATAITVEAIKKAFANPATALAAGVAAIALGSLIKGSANKILSGGGGGGSFRPPAPSNFAPPASNRSTAPPASGVADVTITHLVQMVQRGQDLVNTLQIQTDRFGRVVGGR